jgi:hypothetical protein
LRPVSAEGLYPLGLVLLGAAVVQPAAAHGPHGCMLDEEFSQVSASTIHTTSQQHVPHRQLQQGQPGQYTAMLRVQLFGATAAGFFSGLLHAHKRPAAFVHLMPRDWVAAGRA